MSHLYVMQNHVGLVKVGRSQSIEARRKAIEATHGCTATIVAIVADAGDREEEIHLALHEHRMLGEWFDGTNDARRAIVGAAGLNPTVHWPFALADDEAVDQWLNELSDRMWVTSRDKEVQRVIREMTTFVPPTDNESRWNDMQLFNTYFYTILLKIGGTAVERDANGNTIYNTMTQNEDGTFTTLPLPHYITDMDSALSLWPSIDRPSSWEGSEWDCCIAALRAHKARLKLSSL